jgi:hypothetical protein
MSDLKISQLTDGNAAQAADEFVVARSGGNFRIDGASVAAAATSVGTLSSLTVSGDLTVDTDTLKVDSANNRVGVGTATPAYSLQVRRAGGAGSLGVSVDSVGGIARVAQYFAIGDATNVTTGHAFYTRAATATDNLAMLVDASGNVGIGVTPSAWRTADSTRALELNAGSLWSFSTFGLGLLNNAYYDSSGNYKYIRSAFAVDYFQSSSNGSHIWRTAPSGTAGNTFTFTQAMTLDASGNLIVENANAGAPVDIKVRNTSGTSRLVFGNTTGAARGTIAVSAAELMTIGSEGSFPVAFQTNGSERARITSGGDFCVNTTGLDGQFRVRAPNEIKWARATSHPNGGTQYFDSFRYDTTEIGTITGNNTATAYNTSSDVRLKENIAPAEEAGAVIDAIEVVQHDWKVGGHVRYGFVAQTLNETFPEAVTAGDDGYEDSEIVRTWGVDYSKLVPMLVKEIQSLRARVAVLEG